MTSGASDSDAARHPPMPGWKGGRSRTAAAGVRPGASRHEHWNCPRRSAKEKRELAEKCTRKVQRQIFAPDEELSHPNSSEEDLNFVLRYPEGEGGGDDMCSCMVCSDECDRERPPLSACVHRRRQPAHIKNMQKRASQRMKKRAGTKLGEHLTEPDLSSTLISYGDCTAPKASTEGSRPLTMLEQHMGELKDHDNGRASRWNGKGRHNLGKLNDNDPPMNAVKEDKEEGG